MDRIHNVTPIFKVFCSKVDVFTVAEKLNLTIFIVYLAYFLAKCLESSTAKFKFFHLKIPRVLPSLQGLVNLIN